MNSPTHEAISLLNNIGWMEPTDMSMEDIAWSRGFIVKYKEMDGSQGRILMSKDESIITINKAISYQPKINFVIAHEIGHGILHRHLSLFNDNEKTLAEWHTKGPQEKEANLFASELLMPGELFIRKIKNKKLSLPLLEEVGQYFGASKIATFLRYKDIGQYPVMIIYIENGIIKWKSCSVDFPYQWLALGTKLPAYTVAGDYHYRKVEEKLPAKIDAIEWFPEDYVCQKDKSAKLWEQCFPSISTGLVTCLWTA